MTNEELAVALPTMKVHQIAHFIYQTWLDKNGKGNVNYAAKPYLEALANLENVSDSYGYDNGKNLVLYFLGNAKSYRGEHAELVKAELKKRVK